MRDETAKDYNREREIESLQTFTKHVHLATWLPSTGSFHVPLSVLSRRFRGLVLSANNALMLK